MNIFLILLTSGIAVGGIYALIALGFVLIYKATSIINFATGVGKVFVAKGGKFVPASDWIYLQ